MDKHTEILRKYTGGATLEDVNKELEANGFPPLDGHATEITELDKRATTVGYFPWQANGFGILDDGVTMRKVPVVDGSTKYDYVGGTLAYMYICGQVYKMDHEKLVAIDG